MQLFQGMQCITVLKQTKTFESSCQCEACHVQLTVQSFPQQEKGATVRRKMPVESKHVLHVLCLSDYV